MTKIVRYTQPTQAQVQAVMVEARQMRSEFIARVFRGVGVKLRVAFAGGKAPAAA